jgi:hypothetical protein
VCLQTSIRVVSALEAKHAVAFIATAVYRPVRPRSSPTGYPHPPPSLHPHIHSNNHSRTLPSRPSPVVSITPRYCPVSELTIAVITAD